MKDNSKNKSFIARLIVEDLDSISDSSELAETYLLSKNIPSTEIIEEGLRRIRQFKLLAKAKNMKAAALNLSPSRAKAEAITDELMSNPKFSLVEFIQKEHLSAQYRNINLDQFNIEEVRTLLIKYFMMKNIDSTDEPFV